MHLPTSTILRGGTYRIIRFISSGGFGCTYEAEHIMLEKRVAIKEFFVKDFCNRDENTAHVTIGTLSKKGLVDKLRRKFIDEAKALCRLQHPGIVSVQDVFEENGTAYFVMDYVDGKSLSDIIREEGPLPEERAVRYIRQVATALQYVHDNNRLHLDIKPGNIMIDGNDNPVLIDFGASKQYDEEDGENTSTLMGKTPGYAPPEQMSNSVVKFLPATDIYALGATLYKLLTGITPLDVNLRISGEEPEPLPTNISAATRNAITAAMEINKNKRPQSLTAFVNLLQLPTAIKEETIYDGDESVATKVTESSKSPKRTSQPAPKSPFLIRFVNMFLIILSGLLASITSLTAVIFFRLNIKYDYIADRIIDQHNNRYRVELDNKYGFVNIIGKEVIPCIYDYALSFSEGLASVRLNGKWGFIDKTGKEVIPCIYDYAKSFSNGIAWVKLNGEGYYININGNHINNLN